jgi:hypothetical protein
MGGVDGDGFEMILRYPRRLYGQGAKDCPTQVRIALPAVSSSDQVRNQILFIDTQRRDVERCPVHTMRMLAVDIRDDF